MPEKNSQFNLKTLFVWLFVSGVLRAAVQSVMKIVNGEGEQAFHQLSSLDLTYNHSAVLSILILVALFVNYLLKRNRS